jgi:hypothetical protein
MIKAVILAIPHLAVACLQTTYQCVVEIPIGIVQDWREDVALRRADREEERQWRERMIKDLIKNAPDGDDVYPREWN